MMLFLKSVLLLSFFILSNAAYALGLGELTVYSRLNEPLKAHIQLMDSKTVQLDDISIQNANKNIYNKFNLPKPSAFNYVRFKINKISATSTVIELTSKKVLREPFFTFIADMQWPEGHITREYTFLLDPPEHIQKAAFSHRNNKKSKSVTPVKNKTSTSVKAPKLPLRTSQAGPYTDTTNATVDAQIKDKTYTTQQGDTLWKIAKQFRPDKSVTIQQTIQIIFANNPDAFINGNINLLKANAKLNIPTINETRTSTGQLASAIKKPANNEQIITRQKLVELDSINKENGSEPALKINTQNTNQHETLLKILPPFELPETEAASREEEIALIHRALKTSLTNIQLLNDDNILLKEKVSALAEKIKQLDVRENQLNNKLETLSKVAKSVTNISSSENNTSKSNTPKNKSSANTSSENIEKQLSPLTAVKTSDSSVSTLKINSDLAENKKQTSRTIIEKYLSNPLFALLLALFSLLILFLGLWVSRKQKNSNFLQAIQHPPPSASADVIAEDNEEMNFLEDIEKHINTSAEEDINKLLQPGREHSSDNEIEITSISQSDFNTNANPQKLEDKSLQSNDSDIHYELDLPNLNEDSKEKNQQPDQEFFSEINTFMAYGNFETAEQMLNNKITANSDNSVFIMKLFELYSIVDKRSEFIQLAKNSSQLLNSDIVFKNRIQQMYEDTWEGTLTIY